VQPSGCIWCRGYGGQARNGNKVSMAGRRLSLVRRWLENLHNVPSVLLEHYKVAFKKEDFLFSARARIDTIGLRSYVSILFDYANMHMALL